MEARLERAGQDRQGRYCTIIALALLVDFDFGRHLFFLHVTLYFCTVFPSTRLA